MEPSRPPHDQLSSSCHFVLHFRDEEMADRVAKAMIHDIEICGGGSQPEPF
jgi:hypothetical protein